MRAAKISDVALDRKGLAAALADAPAEGSRAAARGSVVSCPCRRPAGLLQPFQLQESLGDGAGAGAQHPEIETYAGTGLDDPTARIRADLTPLGFHASVLSPRGAT